METQCSEFAPLELERAGELLDIINRAARENQGVVIDPDEEGVTGSERTDLLSSSENVNALVRYQRHY